LVVYGGRISLFELLRLKYKSGDTFGRLNVFSPKLIHDGWKNTYFLQR